MEPARGAVAGCGVAHARALPLLLLASAARWAFSLANCATNVAAFALGFYSARALLVELLQGRLLNNGGGGSVGAT